MNSVMGPPTNLQITPDGKLGLVANSVVMNQDGDAWKVVPDHRLFVIDLDASPPKLIDTVTVGDATLGNGDLAQGRSGSDREPSRQKCFGPVDSEWRGEDVGRGSRWSRKQPPWSSPRTARGLRLPQQGQHRCGAADRRQTVSYDKSLDIPSAFNPYNIDITPDGRYVIASNTGAMRNNGDALVTIEATGPHPHVVDITVPWNRTRGFRDLAGWKMGRGSAADGYCWESR